MALGRKRRRGWAEPIGRTGNVKNVDRSDPGTAAESIILVKPEMQGSQMTRKLKRRAKTRPCLARMGQPIQMRSKDPPLLCKDPSSARRTQDRSGTRPLVCSGGFAAGSDVGDDAGEARCGFVEEAGWSVEVGACPAIGRHIQDPSDGRRGVSKMHADEIDIFAQLCGEPTHVVND